MSQLKSITFKQISILVVLTLGSLIVIVSAFYTSSFLAILGTAILFWSAILFYIKPIKHVPLALLNASVNGNFDNIERILSELDLSEKGIHLPPRNLSNIESSLIFVPKAPKVQLPFVEEIAEKVCSKQKDGLLFTPPGFGLSQLFEKEINKSFTKIDFEDLQTILPKILVENLEIAESIEINTKENMVTVMMIGSIFNGVCKGGANNKPRTHAQVGCLLSSALACVLAKVTGKPITIQNETVDEQARATSIEFLVLDN